MSPVYEFKCERCGRLSHVSLSVDERDTHSVWCDNPACDFAPGARHRMVRQKTVPNFVVNGYNAKNGYSGGGSNDQ